MTSHSTVGPGLKIIESLFSIGEKIVLIDYPMHLNVGDLLIHSGEEEFIRKRGLVVVGRYSTHVHFSRRMLDIDEDTTIVFHGGGNFGDIHHPFQSLRERYIESFPRNKIVVFPQTIFYKNIDSLLKASALISKHSNLHVCCRDAFSFETSKRYFSKNSYLVPDMAHFLSISQLNDRSGRGDLLLLRTDLERSASQERFDTGKDVVDWDDLNGLSTRLIVKFISGVSKGLAKFELLPDLFWAWKPVQEYAVRAAIRRFCQYERVITSRMHGHILANLLEIDTVLIDNSYGKNRNYYECWTRYSKNVKFSDEGVSIS